MNGVKLTADDVDYVEDPDSAARLYLELKHQHAEQLRDGKRGSAQQTQRALNKLTAVWPEVGPHAARATSDDLGGLPPELKRTHQRVRGEHNMTASDARNARRRARHETPAPAGSTAPHKQPTGGRGAGQRRRSGTPAPGRRAWQSTGVPAAAADWRDLGLQVVGFGILASLLYVVLVDAENPKRGWPSVVQTFFGSLGTFVRAVVAPVDPLAAARAGAAKPTRTAAPARRPASTAPNSIRLAAYPDNHTTAPSRAPLFTNPLSNPLTAPIGGTP